MRMSNKFYNYEIYDCLSFANYNFPMATMIMRGSNRRLVSSSASQWSKIGAGM